MKKLVTASLFIFWAVVTALLVAGLVFYQKNQLCPSGTAVPLANINVSGGQLTLNTAEIAKHNSSGDCWLIINNKVYNVTSYLSAHPGGVGTISPYCGQEATRAFQTKDIGRPHSGFASSLLANYYIGDLNQVLGQQQLQQNVQNTQNIIPPSGEREDD